MEEPGYRKLIAWQKAHKNAILIIDLLKGSDFRYTKIVDQCLGAATSIGANIAEGNGALTKKQKESYFSIALNSSYEFDNWLQVLKDSRGICTDRKALSAIEKENIEIIKILSKIISTLRSS